MDFARLSQQNTKTTNQLVVDPLISKQNEFEQLLNIQRERREKEEAQRAYEMKFEIREENLIREAFELASLRAAFHKEKNDSIRIKEDELRREEDERRRQEDLRRENENLRRETENLRRKQEDLIQSELEESLRQYNSKIQSIEYIERQRKRRWIEEDRIRGLEEVLMRQDVLDLKTHSMLPNHVHTHFEQIIGYEDVSKEEIDRQIEVLLDILLVPGGNEILNNNQQNHQNQQNTLKIDDDCINHINHIDHKSEYGNQENENIREQEYNVLIEPTPQINNTQQNDTIGVQEEMIESPPSYHSIKTQKNSVPIHMQTMPSSIPSSSSSLVSSGTIESPEYPRSLSRSSGNEIHVQNSPTNAKAADSLPEQTNENTNNTHKELNQIANQINQEKPIVELKTSNIDLDDFAVLDEDNEEETPRPTKTTPKHNSSHLQHADRQRNASQPTSEHQTSSSLQTASAPASSSLQFSSTFSPLKQLSQSLQATFLSTKQTTSHQNPSQNLKSEPPSSSKTNIVDDDDFDAMGFDLSIEPTKTLESHISDWEDVQPPAAASNRVKSSFVQEEGITLSHTERFLSERQETISQLSTVHSKQYKKIMNGIESLLDPKISDFNPFSKLVLSNRETWESCDQCNTYFDRMSIKQTCRTCHRNFCAKCGLKTRFLDLSILTCRIPENSKSIQLIPKNPEDNYMEVKCCSACDKTLSILESKDNFDRVKSNSKSMFFIKQYKNLQVLKHDVTEALDELNKAIANMESKLIEKNERSEESSEMQEDEKLLLKEQAERESALVLALRRFQAGLDDIDRTIQTLKANLPNNPKTGEKFSTSSEIRTLQSIRSTMGSFLLDNKKLMSHYKLIKRSKIPELQAQR